MEMQNLRDLLSPHFPRIVCLCGSTRFRDAYTTANYLETLSGRIVLSVGFQHHKQEGESVEQVGTDQDIKKRLDELHKRKIDLCDEVLVLNVGGYIGESTASEIAYAKELGRPIRYLNNPG